MHTAWGTSMDSICFHSLIVVPIVIVYFIKKFFSAFIVEASHEKNLLEASHADEWLCRAYL
jgi:hypothetical protein